MRLQRTHLHTKDPFALRRQRSKHVSLETTQHQGFQLLMKLLDLLLVVHIAQVELVRQLDCWSGTLAMESNATGCADERWYRDCHARSKRECEGGDARGDGDNADQWLAVLERIKIRTFVGHQEMHQREELWIVYGVSVNVEKVQFPPAHATATASAAYLSRCSARAFR